MKQKNLKLMTWKGKYPGRHLHALDVAILKFLWKWKVSTIAALRQAVAPKQNHNTFNKRIRKLETNGLIECERILIPSLNLWQLTEHGAYAIRESLGPIKDEGFRSASHYHDALVLAFQMGEWIYDDKRPTLITDQELLRYDKESLHEGLPDGTDHRPDGYAIAPREGKDRILAFEVELHAKSVDRYASLIRWYELKREVERVLWLVGNEYVIAQFKKAKAQARGHAEQLHLFVHLDEYLKSGWDSPLVTECAERVGSIKEILGLHMGQDLGEYVGNYGVKPDFSIFTDRRKFLNLSKVSREFLAPAVF
jgi:hypothetical protein